SLSQLAKIINSQGAVVGGADTANPDPFAPNCIAPSCFVQHAFKWQNGVLSDLGTLPGGSSSFALWINNGGQTVGVSQNGLVDPLTGAPASIAVLWKSNGEIINLGTLGGIRALPSRSMTEVRRLEQRPIQSPIHSPSHQLSEARRLEHRHGRFFGRTA